MSADDRLKHTAMVVAAVVFNIHLKRVLHDADPDPRLNFWRLMYGNCMDMAVIDWCKLFGSDHEKHQPVHWKNVVPEAHHDEFRAGLLAATGLSVSEWRKERERVKTYRDKHVAHLDEGFIRLGRRPVLDVPLEATYFYYERLLEMMADRGIEHRYPRNIRDDCRSFAEQAAAAAKAALASTADIGKI